MEVRIRKQFDVEYRGHTRLKYWIIFLGVIVLLIVVYTILFLYARRRQRAFDEQYLANKERHEVFVLNKKRVREKGNSGISKYVPFRTYQVTGRITVGQTMRGLSLIHI